MPGGRQWSESRTAASPAPAHYVSIPSRCPSASWADKTPDSPRGIDQLPQTGPHAGQLALPGKKTPGQPAWSAGLSRTDPHRISLIVAGQERAPRHTMRTTPRPDSFPGQRRERAFPGTAAMHKTWQADGLFHCREFGPARTAGKVILAFTGGYRRLFGVNPPDAGSSVDDAAREL